MRVYRDGDYIKPLDSCVTVGIDGALFYHAPTAGEGSVVGARRNAIDAEYRSQFLYAVCNFLEHEQIDQSSGHVKKITELADKMKTLYDNRHHSGSLSTWMCAQDWRELAQVVLSAKSDGVL